MSLYYGTDPEAKDSVIQTASSMKIFEDSARVSLGSLRLVDCSEAVKYLKVLLLVDVETQQE